MIEFSIPPKPGEVTLDANKLVDLLYLSGHTKNRETLIAAAGYTIGSILVNECETVEDLSEIVGELTDQAEAAFKAHNSFYDPTWVDETRLASYLHYGMERGRIVSIDVSEAS